MLTLRLGIPPDYVLDRMQPYEIAALIEHSDYSGRDDWERARLISYNMIRCFSGSKLAVTDVMRFPWDKEEEEGGGEPTTMSEADRRRLTETAKQYEKILSNGK